MRPCWPVLTINLPQLRTTWEEYLSKDCFGQCGLGTDLGTVLTVSWWGEMSPLWVALSLPRQGSWTLKDRRLGEKTQACPRQAARPGCLSSGLLASQQLTVTHNCKLSRPFSSALLLVLWEYLLQQKNESKQGPCNLGQNSSKIILNQPTNGRAQTDGSKASGPWTCQAAQK